MNPLHDHQLNLTRRQLFGRAALGLGTATMAQMLGSDLLAEIPTASNGWKSLPNEAIRRQARVLRTGEDVRCFHVQNRSKLGTVGSL